MNLPLASKIVVEGVDDIPVLLAHLEQMGVSGLWDEHFPTHGNGQGLRLGWTATIWLVHILSQADHRLKRVQDWVAQHGETLRRYPGQAVAELAFSDDRLGAVLRYLNADEAWVRYEQRQGQCLLRVYELPTATVRVDPTTASTYQAAGLEGLFRRGVSKDHRPALAQVRWWLAAGPMTRGRSRPLRRCGPPSSARGCGTLAIARGGAADPRLARGPRGLLLAAAVGAAVARVSSGGVPATGLGGSSTAAPAGADRGQWQDRHGSGGL